MTDIDRRHFLKLTVAGALAGTGLCGCEFGSGGNPIDMPADVTTLDYSVQGPPQIVRQYTRLLRGPAEPLVTLSLPDTVPQAGRATRRVALTSFVHLSDLHIIDAGSPARLAFLRQYEWGLTPEVIAKLSADEKNKKLLDSLLKFLPNTARPAEAMCTHVLAAMVKRINALKSGPITRRPFDFAISTGDNADSRGLHELRQYLNLLGGIALVEPSSSAGEVYEGLQSYRNDIPANVHMGYWHPDSPTNGQAPDQWKTQWGYPEYPNLMQAAVRHYRSEGLSMPWYSAYGNHDGIDLGVYEAGSGVQRILAHLAERGFMPIAVRGTFEEVLQFIGEIEALPAEAPIEPYLDKLFTVQITPSPKRRQFTRRDFVQQHIDITPYSRSGPAGHGYSQDNINRDRLYFTFDVAPGIKGIVLDTTCLLGGDEGWLDDEQKLWLEQELIAVHGRYYADNNGQEIVTGYADRLCMVFSHHTSWTMNNYGGRGFTADNPNPKLKDLPPFTRGPGVVDLLQRFPNVIAWVNGHTHANKINLHAAPSRFRHSGFWEINTAAHIDFPQQARLIEVTDNRDGTLSIFTVIVDHSDPAHVPPPGTDAFHFGPSELAAVALELAANDRSARALPDSTGQPKDRIGQPQDRNVEMVMRHPFAAAPVA